MATWGGALKVVCRTCGWRGNRVWRSPADPQGSADGFGPCASCRGPLTRTSIMADRRAARAKAELAELENGARL